DFHSEVHTTATDRGGKIGTRRTGIGSTVDQDDVPTAALDQGVQPGIVELTAVRENAKILEIGALRYEVEQCVVRPIACLCRVPRGASRVGYQNPELHVCEGHQLR